MTPLSDLREIPDKLLRNLAKAPIINEDQIDNYMRFGNRPLSPAERDVLRCLSHGLTERMAAETLGRPFFTVRDQSKSARFKLRAKDSTHAVAIAIRQGLL